VPEAVDGDERQVLLRLAEVVQRMRELDAVGDQEVDVFCGETAKNSFSAEFSRGNSGNFCGKLISHGKKEQKIGRREGIDIIINFWAIFPNIWRQNGPLS
jgi:hypothetical protein